MSNVHTLTKDYENLPTLCRNNDVHDKNFELNKQEVCSYSFFYTTFNVTMIKYYIVDSSKFSMDLCYFINIIMWYIVNDVKFLTGCNQKTS